ncbi:hypothetical protein F4780DRAFT_779368 [Xylariomycetidae sp. FL0641]|nr:hypothetical protein F4780DRAFT_779368 [Xylariomycetidae sp. FL0641]
MNNDHKNTFDITNLLSPPGLTTFEMFSPRSKDSSVSDLRRSRGPIPPLSPPDSPATKTEQTVDITPSSSTSVKDPILYPPRDTANSPSQQLLLFDNNCRDTQRIIDDHTKFRPAELFENTTPPHEEHYRAVLVFKVQFVRKVQENRPKWLNHNKHQLKKDNHAGQKGQKGQKGGQSNLAPILPASFQEVRKESERTNPTMSPKISKAYRRTKTSSRPRTIRSGPSATHATKASARREISATPDPSTRRTAAPSRADKDFESLPDYSPPTSTLPADNPNCLKVEWKGNKIDLSNDPHLRKLHEAERVLASILRLDCSTYLTTKRRIFERRLQCLRNGKEFRRTDAQQACKIDVNKASKIWGAYDKVGWLDKKHVMEFL